jgi:hypothetical protein
MTDEFYFIDNPCPHLGNIVTIKLSEDEEVLTASDGTKITKVVETHFQMNYGSYLISKCIKIFN